MKPQDIIKYGTVEFAPKMYRNTYSKTNIIVVGCGGTGGRIIPLLAQHIINHNKTIEANPAHKEFIQHKIKLILIDADTVESKNLKRQNFFEFDISKNKAQVFAERYSALLGLDIGFCPEFFDKFVEKTKYKNEYDTNFIFFDCTDNVSARRDIESFPQESIIISCGNEDTFGQVLVSTSGGHNRANVLIKELLHLQSYIQVAEKAIKEEVASTSKNLTLNYLPTLLELHPKFKDTVKPSCTDIVLENDQSMPINSLVGQLAYNVFYKIISGQRLNYNLVRCNIGNSFSTDFITFAPTAFKIYMKAIFGEVNENAFKLLKEMKDVKFANMEATHIIKLLDDYGSQAIMAAKAWLDGNNSYSLKANAFQIKSKVDALVLEQRG